MVPESSLLDVAEGVDDAVAAALGNSGLAAWLALEWRAGLRPGETVLILGASGALGRIAVQAAKMLGAHRVVAADRSAERLATLSSLGCDAGVLLPGEGKEADVEDLAAEMTQATTGGADVIIDPLWGLPALAAMKAAAPGARHVQLGQLAGVDIALPAPTIRFSSALEFATNPIGTYFDPEKLVEARNQGLTFQEIHQRARAGEYLPANIPADISYPTCIEGSMSSARRPRTPDGGRDTAAWRARRCDGQASVRPGIRRSTALPGLLTSGRPPTSGWAEAPTGVRSSGARRLRTSGAASAASVVSTTRVPQAISAGFGPINSETGPATIRPMGPNMNEPRAS